MQLIEITEPTSIDIKKNMSTLREAFGSNQLNGAIADLEKDVCAQISSNINEMINDSVSKFVEDITIDNSIKEPIESKVKDLNGIVKTNGDGHKENETSVLDNDKNETENNGTLEKVSGANGQSNESSSLSEPCKSPASTVVDIISTVEKNINLEQKVTIDSNVKVNTEEEKNIRSELKTTNISFNNKDVADVESIEKSFAVVESQADVSSPQVSDADELKHIEISVENKDMVLNISAFSPNSDTNEKEINISAQLQQLEEDASMEEELSNSITDAQILTENKSNKLELEIVPEVTIPSSPVLKQTNEYKSLAIEQQKNSDICIIEDVTQEHEGSVESHDQEVDTPTNCASEIHNEKSSIEAKTNDNNILLEKNLKILLAEDKQVDSSDSSLDETLSTRKVTELNQGIVETTDNSIKNGGDSDVIEELAVENAEKHCNIVMQENAKKPVQEQNQESSNNVDPDVDIKSPVQKYITVKKFTDMTYPVTLENNEDSGDKNMADKEYRNEVMEVDALDSFVTPDNSVSLGTSESLPLIQKNTEVENNVEMTETTNDKIQNNKNLVNSEENQQPTIIEKNIDSDVMEIEDVDEVSITEKSGADATIEKSEVQNTTGEVNNCEKPAKQDAVINITDNDDEEIKSCAPEYSQAKADKTSQVISIDDNLKRAVITDSEKSSSEVEIIDEDSKVVEEKNIQNEENISDKPIVKQLPVVCKLSNTMDILSDEEDEPSFEKTNEEVKICNEKSKKEEQNKCINLDDDDDIMFIEDTNSQGPKEENKSEQPNDKAESETTKTTDIKIDPNTGENNINSTSKDVDEDETLKTNEKDYSTPVEIDSQPKGEETKPVEPTEIKETKEPLITKSFLKSVTKNLADMTRNELEDFCILKLVESVVDKSNLNEIKIKMKTMAQTVEDLRKKALALTKQNRDLQVVVKTVQEDQKKRNANPMMPMKITRSVGMQVVLSGGEKSILKKKLTMPVQPPPTTLGRPVRNMQSPKTQKPAGNNIPVPRLVPASSPTIKSPATPVNSATKPAATVKNTTPQRPEKRPHSKISSPASSVTVDLTDDEPPAKINTKNPTPPVRLVPSQNLMAPKTRPQFGPTGNSPRKVYIPISSNNQNIRPGSTVIKNFVPTPRPRQPSVVRMQTVRLNQVPSVNRHPAPLPDAMKQYQPPTWKALPPAPDLKLSKVDNGIVISWKFEGYQPDTYEEVASFQLYAYQETPAPPSTALWKKIGDIKALPLPMACTLTQFMSGFKYYFAVRAIDVRSRIGPFSLPGSIMLISKS